MVAAQFQPQISIPEKGGNLTPVKLWIKQIITSKILILPLLAFFIFLLILVCQGLRIDRELNEFKKTLHTRICANLISGVPQKELSEVQRSRLKDLGGSLPRCGDKLSVIDAQTNGPVTPESSQIRVETSGFLATDCDRAEITLRLVKESQVIWEKKEVDSSCSASEEGKPNGNYTISLAKPDNGLPLEEAELEICFDLINKTGERASQNPVPSCEILAFIPYLCQKIPIPNAWR